MDDLIVYPVISYLRSFPIELISILTFFISALFILGMLWRFGKQGLIVYNVLAIILANIQVLKVAPFTWFQDPVALGTVTFVTTFLTSDLLTEHYGARAAKQAVWLGFWAQLFFTVSMIITIGHKPLTALSSDLGMQAIATEQALEILFTPSVRIFLAGLIAYVISQILDIYIFSWIRRATDGRFLWLRASGSTLLSNFVDNALFGILAWIVLAPTPISFHTLLWTYILGTYGLRVVLSLLSTPVLYASFYCLPKAKI